MNGHDFLGLLVRVDCIEQRIGEVARRAAAGKLLQEDAGASAEVARYDSAQTALEELVGLSGGKTREALARVAIGQVSDVAEHMSDIAVF
ncbi:hypothetical protein G7A66_08755 [Altererythrobacter sp. SALINAS58]|uniref:hypothetical protein n=1 Tax=Alteripontixanthobacter muriae TaxID=2705546 RepID=UPI001576B2AD|nr:hypothetical protein [Alteripontixanthobacter muriae]NTZ43180.1 hypothetical protein [Alteripontixanthobacter muriae]